MPSNPDLTLPKGVIVPNHIAIVLDGNGRWARAKGFSPAFGHEEAARRLKNLINACRYMGVHTLTLWGFSTENWKRHPKEVNHILNLVKNTIKEYLKDADKEGVKFIHLGRKDRLPKLLTQLIERSERETKHNTKYVLNLALDYGGRDEITRAIQKIVADNIPVEKIDENLISSYLDTNNQPYPEPDLFIRPSGEQRTSGFMPWQMAYSEYYFEEVHLPDITPEKIKAAILDYSRRRRRFGAKDKVFHFKYKPQLIANLEVNWWRLGNIPEGTRFRDYAIEHLKEQYGLSKELAKEAAILMTQAFLEGKNSKWEKAKKPLKKFYQLIKDELKLAFEPSLVASLEVAMMKEMNNKKHIREAANVEDLAKEYYAEVYRISLFQAAKAAHLRVLANVERNLAEQGLGDEHWDKAEDYLYKFYSALKERVA